MLQPETKFSNMLDPSTWVVGSTGSQTGFAAYGPVGDNIIVNGYGPEGTAIPLWKCVADAGVNADGGWDLGTTAYTYDPSKAHRFSVFVKRTGSATGGINFGLYTDSTPDVYEIAGGAGDDNPYFFTQTDVTIDGEWR